MKLNYYPDTDSLYINLSEKPGADAVEISEHVVVEVDETGVPVGIDIDANASKVVDLSRLDLSGIALGNLALTSDPKAREVAS
jgi:uncharacterized protein YuzE